MSSEKGGTEIFGLSRSQRVPLKSRTLTVLNRNKGHFKWIEKIKK
jgi:hypothetical protein